MTPDLFLFIIISGGQAFIHTFL